MDIGRPITTENAAASTSSAKLTGDINADLDTALTVDLAFKGSYYHRSIEPTAPNPGLAIQGLGSIGLPLSERDAHAIISCSAQAPFGKGLKTVVDTTVRDTWELEPSKVSFGNPAWTAFVDEVATKKVWTTLGVAPYSTRPRCELYKLLLYQKGSHFLPHQDTAKANGMFATIIIVLPSPFTGGEVHVSHGGRTSILDVSQGSNFNTSVLAWYTDVMHEVKPVTSGYRLALSYNLIHTSPNSPQPALPTVPQGALQPFIDTVQRWKANNYKIKQARPLFVKILEHQYSQNNLGSGVDDLKGKDAYLVSHLAPIAEKLGIVLCLANIERHVTGSAEDSGCSYAYNKRRRYGYYDEYDDYDREGTPDMGEIEEDEIEMSNIVRITQNGAEDFELDDFSLDTNSLVPKTAFKSLSPDESEYEGYQGNYAGSLEQWYRCSALVLYRTEDELPIIMSISGPEAVLDNLPMDDDDKPAKESLEAVDNILATLKESSIAVMLLNLAIDWKQHEMWNKAIPVVQKLETINGSIADALKVFPMDMIKPGLVNLVQRQSSLQQRLDLTKALAVHFPEGINSTWIKEMYVDVLSGYSAASVADIPTLVQLAQEQDGGFATLTSTVIPRTKVKAQTFSFHVALAEALLNKREQLSGPTNIEGFNSLVKQCLLAAAPHWATPPPKKAQAPVYYTPAQIEALAKAQAQETETLLSTRIVTLIRLCYQCGNPELCVNVFNLTPAQQQMTVLSAIQKHDAGASSLTWVKGLMQSLLSTYTVQKARKKHSVMLTWIAEVLGPDVVQNTVISKVEKKGTYDFFIAMAQGLQESLTKLRNNAPDTPPETLAAFRSTIEYCVVSAAPQWEEGLASTTVPQQVGYSQYTITVVPNVAKVKRIIALIDMCITIDNLAPCSTLFNNLLQIQPNVKVADRFKEVLTPLMPLLKATLDKHGKRVTLEPFRGFIKQCNSLYFGRILSATAPAQLPVFPTRNVGCGTCAECKQLNTFVGNQVPRIEFRAPVPIRTHIEKFMAQAKIGHIVTYQTVKHGTPHTLVVSKRPEIMASLAWREAHAAALGFVRSVGATDEELKEVMQDRFEDMVMALHGTRTFVVSKSAVVPAVPVPSTSSSVPSSSTTPSNAPTQVAAAVPAPQVAGTKRKHRNPPTNVIDVIELSD